MLGVFEKIIPFFMHAKDKISASIVLSLHRPVPPDGILRPNLLKLHMFTAGWHNIYDFHAFRNPEPGGGTNDNRGFFKKNKVARP